MTIDPKLRQRLQFLARTIRKECLHLTTTDKRLFENSFGLTKVTQLEKDPDLAERVEAFVSRFGRLQDTLGDKLLPLLLVALGEKPSSTIDNLDKAERMEWVESADQWFAMRKLRNQMIHEYVEDPTVLLNALQIGHSFVSALIATANKIISEIERREVLSNSPLKKEKTQCG